MAYGDEAYEGLPKNRDLGWEARKLRSAILGMQGALVAAGVQEPFVLHIPNGRAAHDIVSTLKAGLTSGEFEPMPLRGADEVECRRVCLGAIHGIKITTSD